MAKPTIRGTFTIMHVSTNADFENFTYGAFIIDDNAAGPFTINGETIDVPNGWDGRVVPLDIREEGTVLDADLVFLGNPIAPQTKVQTGLLSATTETFQNNTGRVDTYQYIDIKTGNPIRS